MVGGSVGTGFTTAVSSVVATTRAGLRTGFLHRYVDQAPNVFPRHGNEAPRAAAAGSYESALLEEQPHLCRSRCICGVVLADEYQAAHG